MVLTLRQHVIAIADRGALADHDLVACNTLSRTRLFERSTDQC
jgi:hypothetical protein